MNISVQRSTGSQPFLYDDIEKAVKVHFLNLDHYQHKEIYARLREIVDFNNTLRGIV